VRLPPEGTGASPDPQDMPRQEMPDEVRTACMGPDEAHRYVSSVKQMITWVTPTRGMELTCRQKATDVECVECASCTNVESLLRCMYGEAVDFLYERTCARANFWDAMYA